MIKCNLCKQVISKYKADVKDCGGYVLQPKGIDIVYVCDQCCYSLSLMRISRI